MANGPGPRQPEEIHILPDDMMDLPIDAKIVHMARMQEGYFSRLFVHVYGIEYTLKDDLVGLCPRFRSVEEYQAELKNRDAIGQVAWVKDRRKFEGKILVGVVGALLLQGIGLIFMFARVLGSGGG